MKHDKTSPVKSVMLSKIMSAYADIWADVILNKNLDAHLNLLNHDLVQVNGQIAKRQALNENPIYHYQIASQLYRMREIILQKIIGDN